MTFAQFDELFAAATDGYAPFAWQRRFAAGDLPQVVRIPTGAGKTEGASLGWLWRRRFADQAIRMATPRRLVYCLPMRTLVEQTVRRIRLQHERLGLDIAVHQLMGGTVERRHVQIGRASGEHGDIGGQGRQHGLKPPGRVKESQPVALLHAELLGQRRPGVSVRRGHRAAASATSKRRRSARRRPTS